MQKIYATRLSYKIVNVYIYIYICILTYLFFKKVWCIDSIWCMGMDGYGKMCCRWNWMHLLASNCKHVSYFRVFLKQIGSCLQQGTKSMPFLTLTGVCFLHETSPIIAHCPVVIEVRYRHILEHCHLDRSMEVWNAFWLLDRLTYAPLNHTRKGGVWVGCILVLFIRLWYVISVCTLCMWLLCLREFPFLWRL